MLGLRGPRNIGVGLDIPLPGGLGTGLLVSLTPLLFLWCGVGSHVALLGCLVAARLMVPVGGESLTVV